MDHRRSRTEPLPVQAGQREPHPAEREPCGNRHTRRHAGTDPGLCARRRTGPAGNRPIQSPDRHLPRPDDLQPPEPSPDNCQRHGANRDRRTLCRARQARLPLCHPCPSKGRQGPDRHRANHPRHPFRRAKIPRHALSCDCRTILEDKVIALFELTLQDDEIKVVEERHYRLVPGDKLDDNAIRAYRS